MVLHLRKLRLTTQRIALVLGIPKPTVARAHKRNRQSRLPSVEPAEPVMRHEWKRPGDLIHLDTKQQGRIERPGPRINGDRTMRSPGAGWEYVQICIDDCPRLDLVEVLPDEKASPSLRSWGRQPHRRQERARPADGRSRDPQGSRRSPLAILAKAAGQFAAPSRKKRAMRLSPQGRRRPRRPAASGARAAWRSSCGVPWRRTSLSLAGWRYSSKSSRSISRSSLSARRRGPHSAGAFVKLIRRSGSRRSSSVTPRQRRTRSARAPTRTTARRRARWWSGTRRGCAIDRVADNGDSAVIQRDRGVFR